MDNGIESLAAHEHTRTGEAASRYVFGPSKSLVIRASGRTLSVGLSVGYYRLIVLNETGIEYEKSF